MKPKDMTLVLAVLVVGCSGGTPQEPRPAKSPPVTLKTRHPADEPTVATAEEQPAPHENERNSKMAIDQRTFGRVLGETARAVQKVHLQVLAREGTDFESWVLYLLLSERGSVARDVLVLDWAQRIERQPEAGGRLLEKLISAGQIRAVAENGETRIEWTQAGNTYFSRLREAVGQITHHVIGHLDPEEVATTIQVLHAVRKQAETLPPPL